MKKLLLIILNCILSHLFAQVSPKVFHHLSVNDGLSQSCVVSIAQDSIGFIWMATQDGLNRYDGKEFIYFEKYFDDITNAANNRLGKIFIDNQGTLWIIPKTHVPEFYNAYKRSFIAVRDWKNISCMSQDPAGNYWLGTYNGQVLKYDKRKQTKVYKVNHPLQDSNQVYQCFEDNRKQLWITSSGGLFYLNKDADTISPAEIKNNNVPVYSIAEDAKGTLWIGTLGRGIFYKTISNTSFLPFNADGYKKFTNDNFSELTVETIFCDDNNNVWTGTYGNGIYLINTKEKTISNYTPDKKNPTSLNYKDALCIVQDKENMIWIGTDGGGVNIYDSNSGLFKGYSSATVPAEVAVDVIRCIYKDHSGNTWLGTSGKGLTRLMHNKDVAEWKTFVHEPEQKNSIAGNRIMCLAEDKNYNLWIGTQETGVTVFNNKTQRFYPLKSKNNKTFFPDKTIWCLYPQPDGSMWAGTESNGLCLINSEGKLLKQVLIKSGEKIIKNIRCMAKGNNGDMWIGTDEDGLYKYNSQKDVYELICENNIEVAKIKCLYFQKNKNKLWIGTNGHGLACLDIQSNSLNFFSTRHGLPNNVVYGIVPQNEESLWLSTNKGICNFQIPALGISPGIVNYTQKDGLHNMEYNTGAYYKDDAGTVYFGGIDGFNWFSPAAISKGFLRDRIVFTDYKRSGKNIVSDSSIETKNLLELKPGENDFSLSFTSLNFSRHSQLQYRYRLHPYDKDWINAGNNNTATYTNLNPGRYQLQVNTGNAEGWSKNVKSIHILVHPRYWQTAWFTVLFVAFVGLVIYWLVKRRIAAVRKEGELKHKIAETEMQALRAQMNPHFIFNCINAIDNLIQTNQKDKATTYLTRFAKLIRAVLDSSKNNVVPFHKDYEALNLFLQLEQFRCSNKFEYELKADEEIIQGDYKVPPLLVQPFIENAIHHGLMNKPGGDRKLSVLIGIENEKIRYTIKDNGVGRQKALQIKKLNKPEHISYGIQISTERIHLYNKNRKEKDVVITDLCNDGEPAGTKVEVSIKINNN